MSVSKLKRKILRNIVKARDRKAKLKFLTRKSVISFVDPEIIKQSFKKD
jgi:hypothetical protein